MEEVISGPKTTEQLFEKAQTIDPNVSRDDITTALRILDLSYFSNDIEKTYGTPIINVENDTVHLTETFANSLTKDLFKTYIEDILKLADHNNKKHHAQQNGLLLHQKYTRKDVIRVLNWESDASGAVNGYMLKHQTLPTFINYHKAEDISDNTKYEDALLSPDELKWFTKSNRRLETPEVQNILNHQRDGVTMYVFVKKEDSVDGKQHYYLGKAKYIEGTAEQSKMPKVNQNIVSMHLSLENPVKDELYRYIIDN